MEATAAPAKKISVGNVVNETFSVYFQNAAPLIGSAIAVFLVVGLIAGILQSVGGVVLVLIGGIVRLAGYALYTGFVVKLVEDVRDGKRDSTIGDLFSSVAPAMLSLIAFGILFAIGVGLGLIVVIVPGLILLTFWSVGAPAIVVEGIGPVQAMGRSWALVRGSSWPVFGTLVVILLIVIVFGFVLGSIATPIGDGAIVVASIISGALTAPVFSLAVSVMYFDLGGSRVAAAPATPIEPPPPAAPAA